MDDYSNELPENYYFGGGTDTFATPLAIAMLCLGVILLLTLPRKYAFVPFLIAGILIPQAVTLSVGNLHFYSLRLLLLAGWTRILIRHERYPVNLNSLDRCVLYSVLVNSLAYCFLWREFGAVVNRLGYLFSTLGLYFLLRSLIRTRQDIILAINSLAVVVTVIAPLMWYEHTVQKNIFSLFGASEFPSVRDGKVRAAGPFAHAIVAGTFGVVLLPLFVGLWWRNYRSWLIAATGAAVSLVMMIASSSSTPVMTLAAVILALCAWPLRKDLRKCRWALAAMFIGLHVTMTQPVWFLLNRISGVLGGSGWHRAMLIDNFVRHFFEWFFIGTKNNANWGWSMWDVDNAYVGAGLGGGVLGFILFLAIFVVAYRMIGVARSQAENSKRIGDARIIWAIGAALFANTVAFFGIVYFDQSIIVWHTLLVMISVVATFAGADQAAQLAQPEGYATRPDARRARNPANSPIPQKSY